MRTGTVGGPGRTDGLPVRACPCVRGRLGETGVRVLGRNRLARAYVDGWDPLPQGGRAHWGLPVRTGTVGSSTTRHRSLSGLARAYGDGWEMISQVGLSVRTGTVGLSYAGGLLVRTGTVGTRASLRGLVRAYGDVCAPDGWRLSSVRVRGRLVRPLSAFRLRARAWPCVRERLGCSGSMKGLPVRNGDGWIVLAVRAACSCVRGRLALPTVLEIELRLYYKTIRELIGHEISRLHSLQEVSIFSDTRL